MPSFITDILRLPVFPLVALVLIAILYWRGALTMRLAKTERAAPAAVSASKPDHKPKST